MPTQRQYSLNQDRRSGPGTPVDGTPKNGRTRTALLDIPYGAAVQFDPTGLVVPLIPGGVFAGIAGAGRLGGAGAFDPAVQTWRRTENVPVHDSGNWWGVADKAFSAGAALNWNSATYRWTDAAASGGIIPTPGVEAGEASAGNGAEIPIRIKRIRN